MLVSVEVTGHDKAFGPLLNWMMVQQQAQLLGQLPAERGFVPALFRKLVPGSHELQARTKEEVLANGTKQTHFSLVPGPGRHVLRYRNAFISVKRSRESSVPQVSTGEPFETMTLTTLFSQRYIFQSIFQEASELASRATEGRTVLLTPRSTDWEQFGNPKRKRPLSSVVLEPGVKEKIISDITTFLSARSWYLDRGIPYRRGYLLYGPPGTGKSSFIEALAGHLDFNIAMLTLSERGMTDDRLNMLLNKVPPRTLVLLEDADAAFTNRRQADADGYAGATVTFSGLLNALDGVISAEERLIFLTTNHIERMDAAVVRPGRVDMTVRLGEADETQVRAMWERFYGEQDQEHELREKFVGLLKDKGMLGNVSTAQLQGLFVVCKDQPGEAVARVDGMSADLRVAQEAMMR